MSRFKNANYILIIIVICFIGVLLFGGNLLLPKFQKYNELRKKVEEKRNEIKYSQEYFLKLTEVKTELKKYEVELAKIDSALPNDSFLPSVFNYLQKTTAQSGLVLKGMGSFSVVSSGKDPDIKEITLGLEVSGPYDSFKNFLSTLEKSARLIEVGNISFAGSGGKSTAEGEKTSEKEEEVFNFSLSIKVHSY